MAVMGKDNDEDISFFVAGATLVEAAYDAMESPGVKGANLEFTKNTGMPNVSIVDNRTPPDVLDELVDALNDLNGIAGATSFVELYDKIPDIEAKWKDKRADDRRRRAAGKDKEKEPSYEVLYRDWFMETYSKKFGGNFEFFKEPQITK